MEKKFKITYNESNVLGSVPYVLVKEFDLTPNVLKANISGDGSGTADAKEGDYSAAFSQAFDAALSNALRDLKAQPPPQSLETTPKGEQK